MSKPFGSFIPSGSDVTIKCNEGFLAKDVKKITCQNGKLSVKENITCDVSWKRIRTFLVLKLLNKTYLSANLAIIFTTAL